MLLPLRTLIVDDEPLARARLRRLLSQEPEVQVAAECATTDEAVMAASALRPDVVLLDIRMPGRDGFALLDQLPPADQPLVIFVTAYSDHAVRAFEAQALDYVVKPVAAERLHLALMRARRQLASRRAPALPDGRAEDRPREPEQPRRIAVSVGPRIRLIPTDEIDYALARANYVELFAGGRSYLVRDTMSRLERRLDPSVFLRVHRSRIVRIDRVQDVEPLTSGQYVIRLKNGVRLTSGRSYRERLRRALGLDPAVRAAPPGCLAP